MYDAVEAAASIRREREHGAQSEHHIGLDAEIDRDRRRHQKRERQRRARRRYRVSEQSSRAARDDRRAVVGPA